MKKRKHFVLITVLLAMITLNITACGSKFDPIAYTQGTLDCTFHEIYNEEFINSLADGTTVESLKQQYEDELNAFVNSFFENMGMSNPSAELRNTIYKMAKDIFAATKYEIGEATEDGKGYKVAVIAYPLLSFTQVFVDEIDEIIDAAIEKATEDMDEEEIYEIVINELSDRMEKALKNPSYGDPQTITLTIYVNNDGYYAFETSNLDELLNTLLNQTA